ncbi:MAG: hypothetical protein NTW74_19450, partial [Acidobacteria bacterium]|nr:hypothetical protein [Acidobacteriota bacterium]
NLRDITKRKRVEEELQLHRLAGVEVLAELEDSKVSAQIPASLPLAKIRIRQLKLEDPGYLGLNIAYAERNPINKTNPIEDSPQ